MYVCTYSHHGKFVIDFIHHYTDPSLKVLTTLQGRGKKKH